jgi:hypothetical protein
MIGAGVRLRKAKNETNLKCHLGNHIHHAAWREVAREQSQHVSDLKTCGHNVDLKKAAQKARFPMGRKDQN